MTAVEIAAWGLVGTGCIGAFFGGIVTVVKAIADMRTELTTVRADTEAIKGHVNSEKTAAEGREATLRQENKLLREMLNERKETAALLAQAVATRGRTPPAMPASGSIPVVVVNESPLPVDVVTKEGTETHGE